MTTTLLLMILSSIYAAPLLPKRYAWILSFAYLAMAAIVFAVTGVASWA